MNDEGISNEYSSVCRRDGAFGYVQQAFRK